MRLLVTIPHYCRVGGTDKGRYRSEDGDIARRIDHVTQCLHSLHETFGPAQRLTDTVPRRANKTLAMQSVHVILVTTGRDHLVDHLPRALFSHSSTDLDPRWLGFYCHHLLRQNLANCDRFAYLEDDLAIRDPLFFAKLDWFEAAFGPDCLLQPNRFEADAGRPTAKLYIDGPPVPLPHGADLQDVTDRPRLEADVLGQTFRFERVANPHAGSFFLSLPQMRHIATHPDFCRVSNAFMGPLESAATLSIMRAFRVYKPDRVNAGFLELQHLGSRFIEASA